MSTGFTRFFAWVMILSGVLIIVLGGFLAVLAWQIPSEARTTVPHHLLGRVGLSIVCVVVGFMTGAPLIVFGQLVRVFLDMRRHLARIERRLRRRQKSAERESPLADRLLRHRPPRP